MMDVSGKPAFITGHTRSPDIAISDAHTVDGERIFRIKIGRDRFDQRH